MDWQSDKKVSISNHQHRSGEACCFPQDNLEDFRPDKLSTLLLFQSRKDQHCVRIQGGFISRWDLLYTACIAGAVRVMA